jgi:DNA-binding NtrC family response regulator
MASTRTKTGPVPRLSPTAERIRQSAVELWGQARAVEIYGRSPAMLSVLDKVEKIARFKEPILITGESGTGKELIASACHLLSPRATAPFEAVNCPQFHDSNLTVSELFGHTKGSFTGATANKKGHFETANGGSVFLDEVADLPMAAQMMLLRALAQHEFKPLGSETVVRTNVRTIAATNRPLADMILSNDFREDLYFRLRFFHIEIPPLRQRDDDWKLLMANFLNRTCQEHGIRRSLSPESEKLLGDYKWPGNVRELRSVAVMGYCMADGEWIEPEHFQGQLQRDLAPEGIVPIYTKIYQKIVNEQKSFWEELYTPFMAREINRPQAIAVIRRGLVQTRGSYRELLRLFNLQPSEYQRFMDFLRHQRLKPEDLNRRD